MSRKTVAAKFLDEEYDITVTGRNVLVTDAMKDYAIEKLSKIDRFNNRISDVAILMDIQKIEHKIDISLKVDQILIKSSAATDDMYASIDKAVDRLQTQLRRYNKRIHEHHKRGVPSVDMNVRIVQPTVVDELLEVNDEIESETRNSDFDAYHPHKIVSNEMRPLKTLTYDEAIMKMELSGDSFLVFKSEDDHRLKVIYRRKDNNFGIIEPEK